MMLTPPLIEYCRRQFPANALNLTETLGLEPEGMLRVGLLHYNTLAEVERLLEALHALR